MVARGKFFLYDSIVPALEAGRYRLNSSIDIDTDGNGAGDPDLNVASHTTNFNVTAPRLKLPPDQALLTYPPANSEGAYEARLPQIVLKKRTLPWDRKAAPVGSVIKKQTVQDNTPWLALVVIAEGEGQIAHDQPWEDCITPGVTLPGDKDTPRASYLSVPASTVKAVFPTVEDLALLTHVREVNLDDTEAAMGDDDGFLAVVIANRMPQFDRENCRPKSYTACLINLEQQLNVLPAPAPPRPFFELSDIFISKAAQTYAAAVSAGTPVALEATKKTRALDATDANAMTDAVRRGEVVLHDGNLIDRQGLTADGLRNLGPIAPEAFLEGDFSHVAKAVLEQDNAVFEVAGTFSSFNFKLEEVVIEKFFRFPLLTSWRFTCTGAGSFEQLMRDLDVGLLGTKAEGGYRRPLADCVPEVGGDDPGAAPVTKLPLEIAETGHVGVPHITRTGVRSDAWYRGPFSPHQLLRNPLAEESQFPVLAHVSDHLRMMTPEGREDVSLAVAFETGRLLAMSQPSFVASMLRWRAEQFGAARARSEQRTALIDRFGLLDTVFDSSAFEKILAALERGILARELEGGLIAELERHRGGAICDPRVQVDDAIDVPALKGDFGRFLADGVGLELGVVQQIISAPSEPTTMFALQAAEPGLVSTAPIGVDTGLANELGAVLDAGIGVIAELAVGAEAIAGGKLENIKAFESLDDFIGDRFEENLIDQNFRR